jgi:chromosome segregation ATPase
MQKAVREYQDACATHTEDGARLDQYERMRADIESKVSQLNAAVEQLSTENAKLRIANASLEDKAALFELQNQMLEDNAKTLREENKNLTLQVRLLLRLAKRCDRRCSINPEHRAHRRRSISQTPRACVLTL